MKKRILSLALVVVMVALVAAGSMAYFTDVDAKHNELTVGEVDIKIIEEMTDAALLPTDFSGYSAGTVADARTGNKVVDIANDGNVPAYVRLLIAIEDTKDVGAAVYVNSAYGADGIARSGEDKYVTPSTGSDWLQIEDGDGTVYTVSYITLGDALGAGASTKSNTWPLLKGIYINQKADNEWAEIVGDELDILVLAQGAQVIDAAQSATHNIDTAYGWTMGADADAQVAKLFTDAKLGTFIAHTYTAEGAWNPMA